MKSASSHSAARRSPARRDRGAACAGLKRRPCGLPRSVHAVAVALARADTGTGSHASRRRRSGRAIRCSLSSSSKRHSSTWSRPPRRSRSSCRCRRRSRRGDWARRARCAWAVTIVLGAGEKKTTNGRRRERGAPPPTEGTSATRVRDLAAASGQDAGGDAEHRRPDGTEHDAGRAVVARRAALADGRLPSQLRLAVVAGRDGERHHAGDEVCAPEAASPGRCIGHGASSAARRSSAPARVAAGARRRLELHLERGGGVGERRR